MTMGLLTDLQSQRLSEEIKTISSAPKDEPHIVFRLTFDAVRRRQMTDAGEGNEPPFDDAVQIATEIVQKDFEGFQPQIGTDEKDSLSVLKSDAVREILGWLASVDPTDATRLKWMLMPDESKQEMREKYEREWDGEDVPEIGQRFRNDVDDFHSHRAAQQEQWKSLGLSRQAAQEEMKG